MVKKKKPKVVRIKPKPKNPKSEKSGTKKRTQAIHDQFANAIKGEILKRGLTNNRISKDTGISNSALSRFSKPGGTISAESLFVLLDYLDVVLFQNRDGYVLLEETYDELMEATIEEQIQALQQRLPGRQKDE